MADDEIKAAELKEETHKYDDLAKLAVKLFWACAAVETGNWEKSLGVRADWMIVAITPTTNPLLRILSGMSGSAPGGDD